MFEVVADLFHFSNDCLNDSSAIGKFSVIFPDVRRDYRVTYPWNDVVHKDS